MPRLSLGLGAQSIRKIGGGALSSLLSGLLAYWDLNTTSWLDSSGNGITLTGHSGVTLGTGIISGCALISSNGYLDNSSTNFNIGTANIAASAWIKPLSYGTGGNEDFAGSVLDIRGNGSATEWLLIFTDVGTLRVFQNSISYETNATISLNTWTHIAISRSSGTTSFYINGSLDGTFADTANFQSQIFTFGGPVDIPDDADYLHYDGNIDEVGVWNRALSGAEITSLYNAGAGRTYPFN
jgi:hypothetical protein